MLGKSENKLFNVTQARPVRGGGIGEGKMADFQEKILGGGGIREGKMADGNGDRKCRFLAYYWVLDASFRLIRLI